MNHAEDFALPRGVNSIARIIPLWAQHSFGLGIEAGLVK